MTPKTDRKVFLEHPKITRILGYSYLIRNNTV